MGVQQKVLRCSSPLKCNTSGHKCDVWNQYHTTNDANSKRSKFDNMDVNPLLPCQDLPDTFIMGCTPALTRSDLNVFHTPLLQINVCRECLSGWSSQWVRLTASTLVPRPLYLAANSGIPMTPSANITDFCTPPVSRITNRTNHWFIRHTAQCILRQGNSGWLTPSSEWSTRIAPLPATLSLSSTR